MNLMIPFTPTEEARLTDAAKRAGLAPAEFIKRIALENLRPVLVNTDEQIDARLRVWQEQDGISLSPRISTPALFAQWAEEDAQMTDEERDAEDQLWSEIENGLAESRELRLRQLGS